MNRVYASLLSVASVILILDQWTKAIVEQHFAREGESREFLSWFSWTLVHNPGVAFGMFRDLPESFRVMFLVLLPLLVLFLLWWTFVRHFKSHEILGPVAMGLVLGGALGNLTDRIRLGYVIDFVDWFYPGDGRCFGIFLGPLQFPVFSQSGRGTCHWPAFNVADAAIFSAFILLVIHSFMHPQGPNQGSIQNEPKKKRSKKLA